MEPKRGELPNQFLICFICKSASEQPRACTSCIKIFCTNCLISSLNFNKNQCPSCKTKIFYEQFIKSQILNHLTKIVIQKFKKQVKSQQKQICIQHTIACKYYCNDCKQPICSDCGMISQKHKGHKFSSSHDNYKRIKRQITYQLSRLSLKIGKIHNLIQKNDEYLRQISNQYRRVKKYVQQSYFLCLQKIQQNSKQKYQQLQIKQQINKSKISELEHIKDQFFEKIQNYTPDGLIKNVDKITQSLSSLSFGQHLQPQQFQSCGDIEVSELSPEFKSWQYCLKNISEKNGIVYSQKHEINGVQWRLKVYPKGNGIAKDKYISIFVQMTKSLSQQNTYQYKIQLINSNDQSLNVVRQYCSKFQNGQCWGYNQFQTLEELQSKKFINQDSLLFKISIRNKTFPSLVEDQKKYIKYLQSQLYNYSKISTQKSLLKTARSPIKRIKSNNLQQFQRKMQQSQQQLNSSIIKQINKQINKIQI